MADQSFLDGLRSQAGFGMNYTRPSASRSADQNSTISGNPGYSTNMPMPNVNYNPQQQPMSWQQQVMMRQQQGQQLAQDPTNINYIRPQRGPAQLTGQNGGAGNPNLGAQAYQQQALQQQQAQHGGMTPLQYAQQQAAAGVPGYDMNAINAAVQQQQNGQNGGGMGAMGLQFGGNQPGGPQQSMFTQPRPVMNRGPNGIQQMMGMNQGTVAPRGFTPNQMATGPSGSRFVRPMMR